MTDPQPDALSPAPAQEDGIDALFAGKGWVAFNPGTGEEYSPSHPFRSGECVEATDIRPSTPQEDALWDGMQAQFQRALAAEARASALEAALDGAWHAVMMAMKNETKASQKRVMDAFRPFRAATQAGEEGK